MSNQVYVIRNQHGLYLNKQQEWVDGRDAQSLFRCVHHDEAINTVFEVSARDITLRAEALACPLDARKNPMVEAAGQLDLGQRAPADDGNGEDAPDPETVIEAEADSGEREPDLFDTAAADSEADHSPAG